jgi:hypothetical protein
MPPGTHRAVRVGTTCAAVAAAFAAVWLLCEVPLGMDRDIALALAALADVILMIPLADWVTAQPSEHARFATAAITTTPSARLPIIVDHQWGAGGSGPPIAVMATPDAGPTQPSGGHVSISYARADLGYVQRLATFLREAGFRFGSTRRSRPEVRGTWCSGRRSTPAPRWW